MEQKLPLVSFFVCAYNQERYIADALRGAFAQDYENLEIVISDDCSTDGTWDIIQQMAAEYKGSHTLILNRNEKNIGIREHCNKICYELTHGEILIMAAGDDVSKPERTRVCVELMQRYPNVMSMSCRSQQVDEQLNPITPQTVYTLSEGEYSLWTLEDYVVHGLLLFPGDSRVLRRKVIDSFKPLHCSPSEDIFLFIRSLYLGQVLYLRRPLVLYRQHTESIMGKHRSMLQNAEEVKKILADFDATTSQQLWSDLDYAIEAGYVDEKYRDCISRKLERVMARLKPQCPSIPQHHSLLYRIARAIKHEIIK